MLIGVPAETLVGEARKAVTPWTAGPHPAHRHAAEALVDTGPVAD